MVLFPLTFPIMWSGIAGIGQMRLKNLKNVSDAIKSSSDSWVSNSYAKKYMVYGDVETFELECFEEDTAWDDSVPKRIKTSMEAGEAVRLLLYEPVRALDIQVFIIKLKVSYEKGTPNFRRYWITVREEMT